MNNLSSNLYQDMLIKSEKEDCSLYQNCEDESNISPLEPML